MKEILYTDYFERKIELRKIPYNAPRNIIENSIEKYYDAETEKFVKIGKVKIERVNLLLAVVYEETKDKIIVVTAHSTTRQQINLRIKSKRWILS